MRILYLGVHYHNNITEWRSETWINKSFHNNDIDTLRIDYREVIKKYGKEALKKQIQEKSKDCDLIFLQRGEKLSPKIFENISIPKIFWSTEPINLKNDVDQLLASTIFDWVYIHSYSCLDRVKKEFKHLRTKVSVLHNALPKEKINHTIKSRKYFSIFNRNISFRRRWWLLPSYKYIKIIKGHYGDKYYDDLSNAHIAINIHYSSKNKDDFETGIFEALARGCVVVSESLDKKVIKDLQLKNVIIEVSTPKELKTKLKFLKNNPDKIKKYQDISMKSINKNTWDFRIGEVKNKMNEILLK